MNFPESHITYTKDNANKKKSLLFQFFFNTCYYLPRPFLKGYRLEKRQYVPIHKKKKKKLKKKLQRIPVITA